MLMERGAGSVIGAVISPEMVRRATEQNIEKNSATYAAGGLSWPNLRYVVLDARDRDFRLNKPADAITAMYLLHYAPIQKDLER